VLALFGYFKRFENPDGLLEKLESWVFIEWSKANEFVQDLNFPSNMLYAGALAAAGRLYGVRRLEEKANAIRETIRRQSFDGQFFVDNAVRTDGQLQVTRNRTETCQYYAFFFDVATPQSHPELWRTLCEQFGPRRKDTKAFPEIWEANSFIGNMLRVEILSRYGRGQQILDESVDYLLYMADRTGTLWENIGDYASCNHGFASHIVHTLYRDILGIHRVDPVGKKLHVRLGDAKLSWCRGRIPLPQGAICLSWRREGERLVYSVDVPSGWDVEVENLSGGQLVREP
jgi:alpha-L-rhamnosidase